MDYESKGLCVMSRLRLTKLLKSGSPWETLWLFPFLLISHRFPRHSSSSRAIFSSPQDSLYLVELLLQH